MLILVSNKFKVNLGRKLGEGTFGKVYECTEITTNNRYVMKLIEQKFTSQLQF